jgi:hypothetical protein
MKRDPTIIAYGPVTPYNYPDIEPDTDFKYTPFTPITPIPKLHSVKIYVLVKIDLSTGEEKNIIAFTDETAALTVRDSLSDPHYSWKMDTLDLI